MTMLTSEVQNCCNELLHAQQHPPQACKMCSEYRSQLQVAKYQNQLKDSSGQTANDSHCNICYLSEVESVERLQSIHGDSFKRKSEEVIEKEKKAQKLIESEGVRLLRGCCRHTDYHGRDF